MNTMSVNSKIDDKCIENQESNLEEFSFSQKVTENTNTSINKNKKNFWVIHGKKYDFTSFIKMHPGGRDILERALFMDDCGVMFETYHNFSDKEKIRESLQKYEITKEDEINPISLNEEKKFDVRLKPPVYDFTEYEELSKIIRQKFPNRESIKATNFWYLKNIVFALLYLYFLIQGFFILEKTYLRCLFCFIAGFFWIVLGFNIMHDGSHFGISKYPKVNKTLELIWNSFGLWNSLIWYLHHSYGHHSYTGNIKFDPDLRHYRPFAIKYKEDKSKVFSITKKYQDKLIILIAGLFPGMYFGQMISYFVGALRGKIWGVRLPKNILNYISLLEIVLICTKIFILWKGLCFPTMSYMIAQNIFYHFNIAPDHDTYESSIEYKDEKTINWLKLQILHSGNFYNGNYIWTNLFGGINYQIEHHLFPNMSHVHYPEIKKTVMDFAKKKGYYYNEHENILSAYLSFIKNMKQLIKNI